MSGCQEAFTTYTLEWKVTPAQRSEDPGSKLLSAVTWSCRWWVRAARGFSSLRYKQFNVQVNVHCASARRCCHHVCVTFAWLEPFDRCWRWRCYSCFETLRGTSVPDWTPAASPHAKLTRCLSAVWHVDVGGNLASVRFSTTTNAVWSLFCSRSVADPTRWLSATGGRSPPPPPPLTAATITVHLFLCAASCLSVSQLSA